MTYTPMADRRLNESKELFDRMGRWLAEYDDWEPNSPEFGEGQEFDLVEKAMNLFYDIYKDCSGGESPWGN